ncbi:acyl carrier protein [Actinomadura sp. 7K534]|uniref:acyl carrier protein n=1 Tax=Actinomadura sp. 7K534 TaxID=2530366 RepID=UPI001044E7A6|nr:acyl carrier protein [Actinomadura sp. 7K534]TDB89884.1 acyl carrier protein [Actinomadura sp. 7K534]
MNDDLAEVVRILTDVLGEDFLPDMEIGPETTFTGALALESIEFAAFAAGLRARYGDRADLPALVAGLELDELLGMTVGDVADHLAGAAR